MARAVDQDACGNVQRGARRGAAHDARGTGPPEDHLAAATQLLGAVAQQRERGGAALVIERDLAGVC